jgi:uroporphyrinogen-III synthase
VKIVLTREAGHNEVLRSLVPDEAQIIEVPLTRTHYFSVEHVDAELRASPHFGSFETLVVTSPRSQEYLGVARDALAADAQVLSVGRATTRALVHEGITVTAESEGSAADLADVIERGPVLLLGAGIIRDELPDALHKRGVRIAHVVCYETLPVAIDDEGVAALRSADVVFIGAPSAWHVAQEFIAPSTWVVVPGLTTAGEVRATHERVIEGWEPSLRDILATLED